MTEDSDQGPIYVTARGRQLLERRLASYSAQLQRVDTHADIHGVEDSADAASGLESADDRAQLQELLANARALL